MSRLAWLMLWLPAIAAAQSYPYFPPPGIGYSATNGNLTLQNLTLESATGVVLCDGSSGLCAAATGSANQFLATPNGSAGLVALRSIVTPDLPNLGAAPTATVGPTATTGTASTYIHSDGAPAICLTCNFTWTGSHTFDNPILAPVGTNTYALEATAGSGQIAAIALAGDGQTVGNTDLDVYQDGSGVGHVRVNGAFALDLDTAGTNRIAIGAAGNVTVAAPSSGTTVTVDGTTGTALALTVSNGSAQVSGSSTSVEWRLTDLNIPAEADVCLNTNPTAAAECVGGDTPGDVSLRSIPSGTVHLGDGAGVAFLDASASTATFHQTTIATPSATTVPWCNTGAGTANCPLGVVTMILTSTGASAPTITACNRCVSPTATRTAQGRWAINTGLTLSASMVALCTPTQNGTFISAAAEFIYAAAATPTVNDVLVVTAGTSGITQDQSSGVAYSCVVGL